jgi:hypothetical protein
MQDDQACEESNAQVLGQNSEGKTSVKPVGQEYEGEVQPKRKPFPNDTNR